MTNLPDLQNGLTEIALLLERRHFERAQGLAQELLLQFPNNAAVHAVLGEVAGARHQHREAIEWYELALRLDPEHPVRELLARQRELLDQERLWELPPEVEPPRDNRPLLIAGVAGALIILALAIFFISASLRSRQRPPAEAAGTLGRPVMRPGQTSRPGQQGLAAERPASRPGEPGAYGVGAGSAQSAGAPATPPGGLRVTQSVDAPMADRDRLLTRALASLNWPNGDVLGWRVLALLDPFTGYAMITVEVPPGMRSQNLYLPVINMSYKLAAVALGADRGIDSLTIRMLTQIEDDKGKRLGLVAFRGNTTRETMDYYQKRGVEPDPTTIWSHVFATTWWNPVIPAGENGTPAASTSAAPAPPAN